MRARPLPDHDVDAPVLHRRIQQLLDAAVEPVDLVDEEHVVRLEAREDRGHVGLPVDGRAGDDSKRGAHLDSDDPGEGCLPKPRWAGQKDVLTRLIPRAGRGEEDRELLLHRLLAYELRQPPWPQRLIQLLLAGRQQRIGDAVGLGAHPVTPADSAWRIRSPTGSSSSIPRSAASASATDMPRLTSASRAAV